MSIFVQDVRYAARTLRKAPAFALAAILVLGSGIGATTAIFSLIDAALVRPLHFHDAERLVKLFERTPQHPRNQVALLNFQDWRDQSHSFASMAAASSGGFTSLSDASADVAETVATQTVTPGFFEVLGIRPIAGRTFAPGESNDLPFIVLSERIWRNRFNSNPSVVGGTVKLGGISNTVIGIVAADFEILSRSDVWTLLPIGLTTQARRLHFLDVIARLEPGVTIDQARADLAIVAENIARISPDTNKGWGVTIEPLQRAIVSDELRRTSLVLGGGVLFLLLMACANVANLLLAKGLGRTRELAVRAAIGGSRARIIRQLLTESLLLASISGVVGVLLSWMIVRAAPSLIPPRTIPAGIVLEIDWRLMAFALALTFVTALASGIVPAWQVTRVPLVEAMGTGNRASTAGGRVRAALAITQIAAALLLVTGAGLFVRTIVSLNHVDAGVRTDRMLTLSVALPFYRYRTPDRWQRFYETVMRDVAQLPGVRAASFVCCDVPLDGYSLGQSFEVAGDPPHDPANLPLAHLQLAGPRYFETMGISILQGRAFADTDTGTSAPVCIVNQEFARRYLSGRDPLGASVNVTPLTMRVSPPVTRRVVGVMGQVKLRPGEVEPAVEIYIPFAQNPWFSGKFVVRSASANPVSLAQPIKAAIARVDKDLAVTRVRTMNDVAAEATAPPRFRAQLVGAFAVLAIGLAGVGLLSVLSYFVRQRAREFSIRMALGAQQIDLVRMVLRQGLMLAGLGLSAGLASAFVLLRFMTTLLFGVKPLDPITFAGATAAVGILALVACAAPASVAARADPAIMLRHD